MHDINVLLHEENVSFIFLDNCCCMIIFLVPFNRKNLDPGEYPSNTKKKYYLHNRQTAKISQNYKLLDLLNLILFKGKPSKKK